MDAATYKMIRGIQKKLSFLCVVSVCIFVVLVVGFSFFIFKGNRKESIPQKTVVDEQMAAKFLTP